MARKEVAGRTAPLLRPIAPMEARIAEALPDDPGWQFEPKWDGFRCIALRQGGTVELSAKSGKTLARYFPELVEAIAAVKADRLMIDGEITIAPDGSLC